MIWILPVGGPAISDGEERLGRRGCALISGELVDLLVESVGLPHDPLVHAVVIGNLLGELYAAVEWLHGRARRHIFAKVAVVSRGELVAALFVGRG